MLLPTVLYIAIKYLLTMQSSIEKIQESTILSKKIKEAINRSDIYKVHELLAGHNVQNFTDINGCNLLHLAAEAGSLYVVNFFYRARCDIDQKCNKGNTPLILASMQNPTVHTVEIVKLLLKKGVKVEHKNFSGVDAFNSCFSDDSSLDNLEVAEILYKAGADVDTTDIYGRTPMKKAIYCRKGNSVKWLLQFEADCNYKDRNKSTPLHDSLKHPESLYDDYTDYTKQPYFIWKCLLLKGANVNAPDKSGRTPFHLLLKFGTMQSVELFLKHRADIKIKDNNGKSSIHFASVNRDCRILEVLIQNGCNCMARTGKLKVPLHSAVEFGRIDNVILLCYYGADVNSTDIAGYSPLLTFAKKFPKFDLKFNIFNRHEMFDVLTDLGADINAQNKMKESILDMIEADPLGRQFFVKLFAKLQFLGKEDIDDHQMNIINRNMSMKAYYEKCCKELEEIRNYSRKLPILQFLTAQWYEDDATVIRNPLHFAALIKTNFSTLFPVYGLLIKIRIYEEVRKYHCSL